MTLTQCDLLLAVLDEDFGVDHFSTRLHFDIALLAARLNDEFLLLSYRFNHLVEVHGVILVAIDCLTVTYDILDFLPRLVLQATRIHVSAYSGFGGNLNV